MCVKRKGPGDANLCGATTSDNAFHFSTPEMNPRPGRQVIPAGDGDHEFPNRRTRPGRPCEERAASATA